MWSPRFPRQLQGAAVPVSVCLSHSRYSAQKPPSCLLCTNVLISPSLLLCIFTHHTYPCLFWLLFTYLTSHSSNTPQFSIAIVIAAGSLHSFHYAQIPTGSCIDHVYAATVLHTCLSRTSPLWRGLLFWSDHCCCLSAPFSSCLAGSSAYISSTSPLLFCTPHICSAHSYSANKMYSHTLTLPGYAKVKIQFWGIHTLYFFIML